MCEHSAVGAKENILEKSISYRARWKPGWGMARASGVLLERVLVLRQYNNINPNKNTHTHTHTHTHTPLTMTCYIVEMVLRGQASTRSCVGDVEQ